MIKARNLIALPLVSLALLSCSGPSLSSAEAYDVLSGIRAHIASSAYKAPTEFEYFVRTVEPESVQVKTIIYSLPRHFYCDVDHYSYTEGVKLFTVDCSQKTYSVVEYTTDLEAESAWENINKGYQIDYSASIIASYASSLTLSPFEAEGASLEIHSKNKLSISIDGRRSKKGDGEARKIVISDGYLTADVRHSSSKSWVETGLAYGSFQIVKPVIRDYKLVE